MTSKSYVLIIISACIRTHLAVRRNDFEFERTGIETRTQNGHRSSKVKSASHPAPQDEDKLDSLDHHAEGGMGKRKRTLKQRIYEAYRPQFSERYKQVEGYHRHPWNYSDPHTWPDLEGYEDCRNNAQSPVNLKDEDVQQTGEYSMVNMVKYLSLPDTQLELLNNGHAFQIDAPFGRLKLPDGIYDALQFHLHFPSEHKINGKHFAGELHIVHQKRGADHNNDLAVVGVMLQQAPTLAHVEADEVDFFDQLLKFPPGEGQGKAMKGLLGEVELNRTFGRSFSGKFFHYQGSLTTPPCTETVHWYVMETPTQVSRAAISRFKSFFPKPHNNRPVQELNGRPVVKSAASISDEFAVQKKDSKSRNHEDVPNWARKFHHVEGTFTKPWSHASATQWAGKTSKWKECKGQLQSPIDLRVRRNQTQNGGEKLIDVINYTKLTDRQLLNTGHGFQLDGDFGRLQLPSGTYDAKYIAFSFPSEHTIRGRRYAGELQIVHQKQGSCHNNDLAIVSLLVKPAGFIQRIFQSAEKKKQEQFFNDMRAQGVIGATRNVSSAFGVVDLMGTFGNVLAGDYYHYRGSLTTPPCSEQVHWYVMTQPIYAPQYSIDQFAKHTGKPNNRPVQNLNSRKVVMSTLKVDDAEFAKKERDDSCETLKDEAAGKCMNAADFKNIRAKKNTIKKDVQKCGASCLHETDLKKQTVCLLQCLGKLGISQGCGGCFGTMLLCGKRFCGKQCANPTSKECAECAGKKCVVGFSSCSGLPMNKCSFLL